MERKAHHGAVYPDQKIAELTAEITRLRAEVAQQAADLRTLAACISPHQVKRRGEWLSVYADDPTRDAAIAAAVGRVSKP